LRSLRHFIWAWNQIEADSKRGTWPFGRCVLGHISSHPGVGSAIYFVLQYRYEGDDVKRKSWQVDEATPKFQVGKKNYATCLFFKL
jgi:hypothetical protein